MTLEQLYTALSETMYPGIPVAFGHFREPTSPPFIIYLIEGNSDIHADNINYRPIVNIRIELYTDNKDISAEEELQDTLTDNRLSYAKDEAWIDSEKMYMVSYSLQIALKKEDD